MIEFNHSECLLLQQYLIVQNFGLPPSMLHQFLPQFQSPKKGEEDHIQIQNIKIDA